MVSQGGEGERQKNCLRSCGEQAAAPLAERAGQGTASHFSLAAWSKPTASTFIGEHPKPDLGNQSSQTRTTMLSASPLEKPYLQPNHSKPFHPGPSPRPRASPPASEATSQAAPGAREEHRDGEGNPLPAPRSCPKCSQGARAFVPHHTQGGRDRDMPGQRMFSPKEKDAQPHAMASAWPCSESAPRTGSKAGAGQTCMFPGLPRGLPLAPSKWGHVKSALHPSPS